MTLFSVTKHKHHFFDNLGKVLFGKAPIYRHPQEALKPLTVVNQYDYWICSDENPTKRSLRLLSTWVWAEMQGIDFNVCGGWAISWAVYNNHPHILDYLLKHGVTPKNASKALPFVAMSGYLKMFEQVLAHSDKSLKEMQETFLVACKRGDTHMLRLMVEQHGFNPKADPIFFKNCMTLDGHAYEYSLLYLLGL